ncbi:PKD domain-containing protein [Dyadobacter sp. CY261]|uniref:PKD domain-containing protein n=1 Tax=Dyadobacter sp. CY261 TaxID=2907203 RepID=UPI001F3B26E0|nr:PKD domain-containing protein [Dyadobacter sp. CY261]MCF0069398.1 PKD domain-containing protein [Dyadobacter sp. CY261]
MKKIFTYILLASVAIACHIEMPQKPLARFKFTPENGCQAPCNVTFTSESENAAGLQWDFNDGSALQTGNPVVHEFKAGKTYEVKLIIRGVDGGSSGETRSVKIDAAAASAPEADFKYTITNDSIAPATVTFNNQSKNATRYEWNFGDPGSTSNTSTETNPNHIYANPGTYEVTLIAYNGDQVANTKKFTIVVKAPAQSVDAISISGGDNFTTDIAVDGNGNIYVCGTAAGTVNFGNGITRPSASGSTDFFVAKYNSAFQCQWAYMKGSGGEDHVNGLTLDANNNVYVTGFIKGSIPGEITSVKGNEDGFILKLGGAAGDRQWVKTFGGPAKDLGRSLVYSSTNDRIYLTGYVTGNAQTSNIDLNGTTVPADGADGFLVLVNPSTGDFGTPTVFGGPGDQLPEAITADSDGNVYMTGAFLEGITLPGIAQRVTSAGGSDVFVSKWTPNPGQFQWARRAASTGHDYSYDIVVDGSKNVYVTGMHVSPLNELGLPTSPFENVFLGKWNANGTVQKGQHGFNDNKPDYHGGIALNGNYILIAGSFEDTGRFPMSSDSQQIGTGNLDMLIAQVDQTELSAAGFITSGGGSEEDRVNRIFVAGGYVYATGWIKGNAIFNNVPLSGVSGVRSTFIVRYKL